MELLSGVLRRSTYFLRILVCVIFISACGQESEDGIVPTTEIAAEVTEQSTESTEESGMEVTDVSENTSEAAPEPAADPPEFLKIEEVTVTIPNLSREYTFAWVSDLHLIADVPFTEACKDVDSSHHETIQSRYDKFVTADGIHGTELWEEIVSWLNTCSLDGVILGGDMLDYYSKANMQAFREEFDRIDAPVLYIRADHDYGVWYHADHMYGLTAFEDHKDLDGDHWASKHFAFEEFGIVGINESQRSLSEERWQEVKPALDSGKPVLLLTHVPYASNKNDTLYELSMEMRGKEYYWPSDTYKPRGKQMSLLESIDKEDTTIKQVLAGHLHASWDGMINEKVAEHIFGPAYEGNVGIIRIVGE